MIPSPGSRRLPRARCAPNPNGVESLSPGLAQQRLPWVYAKREANPERVASDFARASDSTLSGLGCFVVVTQGRRSRANPGLKDSILSGLLRLSPATRPTANQIRCPLKNGTAEDCRPCHLKTPCPPSLHANQFPKIPSFPNSIWERPCPGNSIASSSPSEPPCETSASPSAVLRAKPSPKSAAYAPTRVLTSPRREKFHSP